MYDVPDSLKTHTGLPALKSFSFPSKTPGSERPDLVYR